MRPTAVALAFVALLLAGCTAGGGGPDDGLPGVRTRTTVDDTYRCGAMLFAQGCVLVRAEAADSGCSPELGGYAVCNATVDWSAASGAVVPGSRLAVAVNGTEVASCAPTPDRPCRLEGQESFTHRFGGPGEDTRWLLAIEARLTAPGDPEPATGEFLLTLDMAVFTEGAAALTS